MRDLYLRLDARHSRAIRAVANSAHHTGGAERAVRNPRVPALLPAGAPGILNFKCADVARAVGHIVVVPNDSDAVPTTDVCTIRIPDVISTGSEIVPGAVDVDTNIAGRSRSHGALDSGK